MTTNKSKKSRSHVRKPRKSRSHVRKPRKSRSRVRKPRKSRSRVKKDDGMDKLINNIGKDIGKFAYNTYTDVVAMTPSIFPEPKEKSYNWYMKRIAVSDKKKFIKQIINDIFTKEAGRPSHDRNWPDDDINYFFENLQLPQFNNREINWDLINELIIKKGTDLETKTEENHRLKIKLKLESECGINNFYKIKDGVVIEGKPLILVKIIGHEKGKCKVEDVYNKKIITVESDILEKRAKDMTHDDIANIEEKIKDIIDNSGYLIYPAGYKNIDENPHKYPEVFKVS